SGVPATFAVLGSTDHTESAGPALLEGPSPTMIARNVPVPVRGHWWTIAPNLLGRLRPQALDDRPWSTIVPDPRPGGDPAQHLAGELGGPASGDLYLLVHGLGGDADSPYMREAAVAL